MEFIISDACIFIDLIEINFINEFFKLPFKFFTTDFVINEIKDQRQLSTIMKFIDSRKLTILYARPDDLMQIVEISGRHPKLSISDCSVFYFGRENNLTVLTNDKRLRQISENIGVHGILWIFDCLLLNGISSKTQVRKKLKELMEINQRLPIEECSKRFNEWER